jgi:hypothetical protein
MILAIVYALLFGAEAGANVHECEHDETHVHAVRQIELGFYSILHAGYMRNLLQYEGPPTDHEHN